MSKITEINYQLPEVFAETFIRELSSSANKPLLIRGRDILTSEKDDFILKPKGGLRMYAEAGMLELLANFIASELNLNVPEPALIHISKQFIESLYGNDNYERISNSEGINFGTKYLKDCLIWQDNSNLIKYRLKDLQEIFIFDMLIDNTDRTKIKPNIIINDENIYILDHEIAFAFAFLINPDEHNPWEITDYEKEQQTIISSIQH